MSNLEFFTAKKLKELAKTCDCQVIKFDDLCVEFCFNADIGITEYMVHFTPIRNGKEQYLQTKTEYFRSYKAAKAFIQNKITLMNNDF